MNKGVNMYEFPGHHINVWEKNLRGTTMNVLPKIGLAAYQRVGIEVLMFRIPSETYPLLDSGGGREPLFIANRSTVCGDLVGLVTFGPLNWLTCFATHQLPSPTFEPYCLLI